MSIVFLAIFATKNRFVMTHDIFISYSSKQKNIADGVCHYLEENGFKCWMAPRDIPIGSEYGDLIEEAIKTSKVVVLVFSEAASISKWVKGEINVAFAEDKPILPFRIDETEIKGGFRVMLNQMHWIDAFPSYAERLPDLITSICKITGIQPFPVSDLGGHDLNGDETCSFAKKQDNFNEPEAGLAGGRPKENDAILNSGGTMMNFTEVDKRILEVIVQGSYSKRPLAAYEAQKCANKICREGYGNEKPDPEGYVEMLMAKAYPVELEKANLGREYVAWRVKIAIVFAVLLLFGIIIAAIDPGDDVSFGVGFIVAVILGSIVSYVLYRKKMMPIIEKVSALYKE